MQRRIVIPYRHFGTTC